MIEARLYLHPRYYVWSYSVQITIRMTLYVMCDALRNKDFHLKPTPCQDSRLTFLHILYADLALDCDYI